MDGSKSFARLATIRPKDNLTCPYPMTSIRPSSTQ